MTEKINRRDLIIETASQLFMEQGYEKTSVRQIAEATGMTEAALYYHFKDGKRALLQAVVECQMPDLLTVLKHCETATSLAEFVRTFGQQVNEVVADNVVKLRWLMREFPQLNEEERRMLQNRHLGFQQRMTELIGQFIPEPATANCFAWTLICAMFGYEQIFWTLDMQARSDFNPLALAEVLVQGFGGAE